jgi:hypothetical protein
MPVLHAEAQPFDKQPEIFEGAISKERKPPRVEWVLGLHDLREKHVDKVLKLFRMRYNCRPRGGSTSAYDLAGCIWLDKR